MTIFHALIFIVTSKELEQLFSRCKKLFLISKRFPFYHS
ncbi:unnamed protein product [Blumeria hordei]|uniref:Uncharacterized protein n=1 Tax=Blumeria hordei TaxID=2867405 RepID=A0A383UZJ4_BLUHO|nr:unnamed protein product [Blumeria hordei]